MASQKNSIWAVRLLHSDLVTEQKYSPSHITARAEQVHWVSPRPILFVTMSAFIDTCARGVPRPDGCNLDLNVPEH